MTKPGSGPFGFFLMFELLMACVYVVCKEEQERKNKRVNSK